MHDLARTYVSIYHNIPRFRLEWLSTAMQSAKSQGFYGQQANCANLWRLLLSSPPSHMAICLVGETFWQTSGTRQWEQTPVLVIDRTLTGSSTEWWPSMHPRMNFDHFKMNNKNPGKCIVVVW